MEHPRRAVPDHPLCREHEQQHRPVAVAAILGRPVALHEESPEAVQRVHALVQENHVPIVVREVVPEARDAGGQREERDREREQPAASRVRHANRLNFRMCQNAATPSLQLIFLPSAYVRPE